MTPYLFAGAMALALATGGAGYVKGRADNEARHVAEVAQARLEALQAGERAAVQERERLAAEQEARLLSQALEDQAYAQPAQSNACLPADRVRRLGLR